MFFKCCTIFTVFCCSSPNLFETCWWHQVQNKHIYKNQWHLWAKTLNILSFDQFQLNPCMSGVNWAWVSFTAFKYKFLFVREWISRDFFQNYIVLLSCTFPVLINIDSCAVCATLTYINNLNPITWCDFALMCYKRQQVWSPQSYIRVWLHMLVFVVMDFFSWLMLSTGKI